MRDTAQTMNWYASRRNKWPGFDPDGMCLKICRVARGLPAVYPSSIAAQEATPAEHRVHEIANLERGMVLYFDHPNDGNPHGHIVTMAGRVHGGKRDNLRDIIVWTNDVEANRIVPVRGDYFMREWGDPFVFGATWLNGAVLDMFEDKTNPRPTKPPLGPNPRNVNDAIAALRDGIQGVTKAIAVHKAKGHGALVAVLERDKARMEKTLANLKKTKEDFS